jgi:1-acyl-sn-glycerol-3-phosphate acyltransferase
MASPIEMVAATAVTGFARLVTGVRANWLGCAPEPVSRIYFANHNSHGDFVLIWTALPPALRQITRPVAGADYWMGNRMRRFFGERVFRAVLIDRNPDTRRDGPITLMAAALDAGSSLILFPEGTRNTGPEPLLPFRADSITSPVRGGGGACAGVDREPQPGDAEGRDRAYPAAVHRDLRRPAATVRLRGQDRIPRPRAHCAA